jgi:hypothetical protein
MLQLQRWCLGSVIIALVTITSGSARAQGAWVGDAKSLTVDLGYAYIPYSAVVENPNLNAPGDPFTANHVATLGVEYVPIENLSIDASLPFEMVNYGGTAKHTPPGKWDDGNNHFTFTDFRIGARYQLLDAPYIALSPYAAVTIPVQDYEVIGFATGGRHLKAGHLGVSAGRTLDPVLPNLFFMASYEFTFAESYNPDPSVAPQVATINQNRSDVTAELGYLFLDGDLSVNLATDWRHQHHGISFDKFGHTDPVLTAFHDGILKESYNTFGGGASYAINRKVTVTAAVRFFIQGYNTRDQSYYGLDVAWRAL